MGFFRKQINTKATELYFRHAVGQLLSTEEMKSHKAKLRELSEAVPEFEDTPQETFDNNLTASNLQLLDFAWAEFQKSKGIDMLQAIQFNFELKQAMRDVPGQDEYDELYSAYNQAVADANLKSSSIQQMAKVFILNVMPSKLFNDIPVERVGEVHQIITGLMQGSFDGFVTDMKDLKLIS